MFLFPTVTSEDTKQAGNFILEHITQCVVPETYKDKVEDDKVVSSLLLQMNAKCGGVSVALDWPALLPVSGHVTFSLTRVVNFLLFLLSCSFFTCSVL